MSDRLCEPLRFQPVYQSYIWGGDRIAHKYGRDLPPGIYAESWEVSDRSEGMSVVAAGPLAGRTLRELMEADPIAMIGREAPGARFPLLVKLIDARERLSVQVHPDDATAARWGGEPKTEAWYVLEAAPGAVLYAGLRPGTDRAALEEAVRTGRIEDLLNVVPVRAGDALFIPAGRVHALGAGILLLEVQQNSNTTYRLYDWGRVGHDGRPRETHVAQAIRAIRWHDTAGPLCAGVPIGGPPGWQGVRLVACPYFRMERWRITAPAPEPAEPMRSARVLFVEAGAVELAGSFGSVSVTAGGTVLCPAALEGLTIEPRPAATLVRIVVA
ncbi:MAG: class I mannose-6-phosphate isomerase [Kiritimatiellae bacterium]|nr:class I mannose-6-phosphate isomerase [Kiritimatiellia bacterium]